MNQCHNPINKEFDQTSLFIETKP